MARKANSKTRRGNKSKRKNGRKSAQRRRAKETNADHFRKMLDWFLPNDGIFGHLKLHGNTSWLPRTLVCLALCWSWAENKCVTDSFTYPLWSLIMNSGFDLLVRVGGNVSLLSEQGFTVLKHNMTVLSWPKDAIKAGGRPLKLRLVRVKVGKADMWLLTSVLDKSKLNQTQIRDVYAGRWGIEVEFRGLKQTLDKAKLRCRTEERVKAELHWSLMAMAIAELFALKEQLKLRRRSGPSPERVENPKKRSLAQTVRALRYCLTHLQDVPETGAKLPKKRQQAVTDSYDRTAGKAARYKPPNPDKKPLGEPRIRKLNIDEKKKLKAISSNELVV